MLDAASAADIEDGKRAALAEARIEIEIPRVRDHGDFSTNVALTTAASVGTNPRDWARRIADALELPARIRDVEVAGPGFVNFRVDPEGWAAVAAEVLEAGAAYGTSSDGSGTINLEFVSANPTGPMHLGHARWAAWGDALARLLEAAGFRVTREFYINDAGNQIALLGKSLAARYMEALGKPYSFPEDGYKGSYLIELAARLREEVGEEWAEASDGDLELRCAEWGSRRLLEDIKSQLLRLGVSFDVWTSERELRGSGKVDEVIRRLRDKGLAYDSEGAVWLKTTALGDEKDRVLVKSDGEPTYLAADIAYHLDKFARGFDVCIDIWGADHAGHVPKLKAALQALDADPSRLEVILGQLVSLSRAGEPVRLSKRSGETYTFEELVDEIGSDAARFHFLMQGPDTALNLDLEKAVEQSLENPVYYVQYAHARMCSIQRKAVEAGMEPPAPSDALGYPLDQPEEIALLRRLEAYPYLVAEAAALRAPHKLAQFARDLAADFHVFYNAHRVLQAQPVARRSARLALVAACRIVLAGCLGILGVSAPESMPRLEDEERAEDDTRSGAGRAATRS